MKLTTDYMTGMEHVRPSAHVSEVTSPYCLRDCAICAADGVNGTSFTTLDPRRVLCDGCAVLG